MAWPRFVLRHAAKTLDPVSAGDRALIDAAVRAGRVTLCPPRHVDDEPMPGLFGVNASDWIEPCEVDALLRAEGRA